MRTLYSLAIYLLTPLVLLHFLLRGMRNRKYLQRWGERFGRYLQPVAPGGIVVHAVSVGEVNAAAPLVRELARRHPDLAITVTSFTPTGSDRVQALFGDEVYHVYAPLDLPGAVQRFYHHVRPRLLIILETEIWPNLYRAAALRDTPILIANARISGSSLKGYRRMRWITRYALARVSRIAAQSELDAQRLLEIGAQAGQIEVSGNLKFDLTLPPRLREHGQALRTAWGEQRPVFLAGSTHEGDETVVLQAFAQVLNTLPTALLVLVPRHPERFARAAQLARAAGLEVHLRSDGLNCPASTQCLVVDAMGELLRFYAACDLAFVGGSIDPVGGHNVLEPAALSVPVLVGPHTFNFPDISQQLLACGGALRVDDAASMERAVRELLGDAAQRERMGAAGLALVRSGQGALARTLQIAAGLLAQDQPGG